MKILKWTGRVVAGLVVLVLLAVGTVYAVSSWQLSHPKPADPLPELTIPSSAQAIARGRHLAVTHGCLACHGEGMAGQVAFDQPMLGRGVAPNIPRLYRDHSPAVIAAGIRDGIGYDGRALWMMPSEEYHYFTDDDLLALLAYIQSLPVIENDLPKASAGPVLRTLMTLGKMQNANQAIQTAPAMIYDASSEPQLAHGEYVARTSCTGCHGLDFRGVQRGPMITPDLVIVKAYNREDFGRLLHEGVAMGERELGMMREVALESLTHMSEQEITDLHAFLQAVN